MSCVELRGRELALVIMRQDSAEAKILKAWRCLMRMQPGHSPSYADLSEMSGIKMTMIPDGLGRLERAGLIHKERSRWQKRMIGIR